MKLYLLHTFTNEPILSQIHLLAPISTLLERLHGTLPSRGEVAALSCCHFGNVVLQIGLAVVWVKWKSLALKSQKVKHKQALFQEIFPCGCCFNFFFPRETFYNSF